MPANTTPIHPLTSNSYSNVTTGTANTTYAQSPTASSTRDGNAAGTNGDRLRSVTWVVGTPNASGGKFQIWVKNGSTYTFLDEVSYSAGTASATVGAQRGIWKPADGFMFLLSGDKLSFSCSQTDTVAFHVEQDSY